MKARFLWLAPLFAIATPAFGDDVAVSAQHGGRVMTLADGATRVEVVRDANAGTVVLYGAPSPSPAVRSGGCPRSGKMPAMASAAPTLVLFDGGSSYEIAAVPVAGQPNAWQFSDARLKSASVDARIRIRGAQGLQDTPLVLATAEGPGGPPDDGHAGMPAGRDEAVHTRMLSTLHARFEAVHDPQAGTLTIRARDLSGAPLELAGKAPTLTLQGGPELTFVRAEGGAGTWQVANERLKGDFPAGTLHVEIDGRMENAELGAPAGSTGGSAGRNAPAGPKTPDQSGREQAGRGSVDASSGAGARSGVLLLGDASGPDLVRMNATFDPDSGTITLRPVSAADGQRIGSETPVLVLNEGEGSRTLKFRTLDGEGPGWVTVEKVQGRHLNARVRLTISGRTLESPLVVSDQDAVGLHGGSVVSFGGGAAVLEIVRDDAHGDLLIFSRQSQPGSELALREAPMLVLDSSAGVKTLEGAPVEGVEGVWRIRAPELKDKALSGKIQVKVGDRSFTEDLPSAARPATPSDNSTEEPSKAPEKPGERQVPDSGTPGEKPVSPGAAPTPPSPGYR